MKCDDVISFADIAFNNVFASCAPIQSEYNCHKDGYYIAKALGNNPTELCLACNHLYSCHTMGVAGPCKDYEYSCTGYLSQGVFLSHTWPDADIQIHSNHTCGCTHFLT